MRIQRGVSWCLFLSLVGIGLSGFLTYLHLGLLRGELLGGAACGGAGAFNCHIVTESAWGSFLGIPLALWGVLGYVTILGLALLARQPGDWAGHAMAAIVFLAVVSVSIDLVLLGAMVFAIHFFCLFCLATYLVNLSLLAVSARALDRPWSEALRHLGASIGALVPSSQRPVAWLFWGMMTVGVLGVAGVHAGTTFMARGTLGSLHNQIHEFVTKQPHVSIDTTGDPTIGRPGAPIQIVEFSDFMCPACQKASKLNAIIMANHRQDAVLSFKNFPLDMTCNESIPRIVHAGACQLAAAGECAFQQGKFWPMHDLLFEEQGHGSASHLEGKIGALGLDSARFNTCMESGEGLAAVKRDIAEAKKANVMSTPTYVINGVPIPGGVSPSMFDEFVDAIQESSR